MFIYTYCYPPMLLSGRLAFHPKDFYSSHKGQEAESVPFREQYGTQRLPKHVQYFEAILSRATPGAEGERYLVGNKITVRNGSSVISSHLWF